MGDIVSYIPLELKNTAAEFIHTMDGNVEIYKKISKLGCIKPCAEADKFSAYWTLASYNKYPHALITLYENIEEIDNSPNVLNAPNVMVSFQQKMKNYYLLLKENELIGE